jgi:DNA-binding LytR/AlgR family response regulator
MNVLIIEDENKTAAMLKELIEQHSEYSVVNVCESIEDSVKYLEKNQRKLDLIFMDIQLGDGQSFEIFEQIPITIPVVFCTAYDEFTLKAFKNNGIDYILKPFKEEDIRSALGKTQQLKSNFAEKAFIEAKYKNLSVEQRFQTSFLARYKEKMIPVSTADIALAYLENETVFVFNFKSEKYIISKTLEQFEKAVSEQQFFRINRQMIVNRNAIKEIEPFFNRKALIHLTVKFSEKPIVSRLKVTSFLEWIENSNQ